MSQTRQQCEAIIKSLREQGFRLTKVRKALIEVLAAEHKPLAVADLLASLQRLGLHPHKTSIYREINFLLAQGVIKKLTLGERLDRFELASGSHHHHAVCQSCGETREVECGEEIRRIERQLENQNFKVEAHLFEFFGLCKNCNRAADRSLKKFNQGECQ